MGTAAGLIEHFMVADHVEIDGLLAASERGDGTIDDAVYTVFRERLLRHIAMEEKVLLPYARAQRGGDPLPIAFELRRDHSEIAKLLVQSPTAEGIAKLRELLGEHNAIEEGPGGLYAECDEIAGAESSAVVERLGAQPRVPLAPDGPPAIGVGAVLDEQYELRTVLGEGANGVVYEAWDRALARRVAVKVRRAGCERSVHDEAKALAAIHHPSVVAVLGIGSAGGHDFMVTELVPGITWGHRLAVTRAATGQPPPPEESVDIAMHVADALASIHRVGLVHGDVKPSNIVVADGRIVLTDFGLARPALLDETAFGGTPTYAAPELFEGKVLPTFGHSVDVYALGVTLFEVLVGQPPFASTDPTELAHLHLHAPVPRVVDFVSVPRRLSALVASMMHKDPSERTESMEVVLFQLKLVRRELDGDTLRPLEILIVDDDPDIARLLAFYVREELPDARIEVVHDGFEAMDVVRRRHPHLILLDLNLPRVSGFEVYAYLRGAGLLRQSSVITVSAAAKRDDEELLLELGVGACIQKDAMLRSNVRARVKSLAFKHGFDSTAPLALTP